MNTTRTASPRRQRGFSLLEAMISLLVATFGLLAAGQILFTAAGARALSSSDAGAVLVARNTLAELSELYRRNPAHDELAPGNHGPRDMAIMNPLDETVLNRFRVAWLIAPVADPRPGKTLQAISIRVSATPIRPEGASVILPRFNRILTFETILTPTMP